MSRVMVFAPVAGANAEPVRVRCRDCGQWAYTFEVFQDLNAKAPAFYCRAPRVVFVPEHKVLPACAEKYLKDGRAKLTRRIDQ